MAKKTKPARVISSFDELDASGIGAGYTPYAVQEDEQAPPAPESSGLIRRIAGDGILTGLKGAIGVSESALGLADMASGGHVGKALENEDGAIGFRPKQAKEYLDQFYSPEQKAAFAAVQNAANKDDPFLTRVGDIAGAAIRNPSTIVHAVGESLPSIGAGGLIGRGVMAGAAALSPRIATAIAAPLVASQGAQKALSTARIAAAGIGEGVVSAGSTAEQIRQGTKDGYMTGGQSLIAAGSGMLTGVLGMASAKAAKALGIGDIDTLLVGGGKIDPALEKGFIRKVLESVLTEGGMEELPQSVQEQVAQNYALGKPLDEGVDNASVMGVLTGGAMGASAQVLSHRKVPEVGPLSRAVNVDGGAAVPQEPAPPLPPVAMSPEQEQTLLALANARNKALTDKANGTKDVKTTAEDGTPVTIPGKQPEFLTPAEKEEQAFLAEHGGDVQALAQAYPGVLAQPAEQEQQRQQPETSTSRGNDGDNAGAGVESGATDGNGVGANPRGAVADSLGQSGEQAGGSDAGAVTPEKQAITDGYALDKTRDSGVRIFRKTDDAGRHMRAINAEGELITSTSNFGEFTISDSYLEYDGPQAFVVSMDNKRGHLTAKNKESGQLIELSPRADKEFADGIPLAKVLETEFSDAGGIKPDGSKTPHTTTVKKSAPTAKQKSNVTTPVAPAAESLQPKPFDTAAAIAQYRAETLAAQQAEAPSVDELFPLPAAPAVEELPPSPTAPTSDALPVDILHPKTGKPFTTKPGAMKAQKLAGDGHEVVKVDGGFVVRAKDTNGTATTTAELDQPTPAQPSADTQAGTGTALAQPGGERAGDVSSAPAVAPGNGSDLPVSAVGSGTDSVAPGDWIKPVVGSDKRPRQVDSVGKDGWVYTKSGDSFKPGQFESTAKPVPTPITGGTGREQGDIPSGNSSTAQLPPTDIRIGDTVRKDGKDYTVTQGIDGGVAATRTVSAQNGVTQEKTIFLKGDDAIRAKLEAASGNSSIAADENPEWTRMPHADRLALNTRAGMSKLVADKIARTPWADITPKTREKITAAMAAPVRSSETANAPVTDKPDTQKTTPAPVDTAQAATESVAKPAQTVESVARAVRQKIAANRRKAREKSRKEYEAKGWKPNSTPESEQADYDTEVNAKLSEYSEKYAAALLGDNPLPLIEMFVNGNFEASEDVFKDITGVKIRGLSAADKKAALYKWAKWTPEQIAKAESDAKERTDRAAEKNKQEDAKTRVMGEWLALSRLQIGEPGQKGMDGQEFVLQAVAKGYDKAHSQKKGIATIYGLTNGKEFTTLKKGAFTDFVKAAIAFGGLDKTLEYVNPPMPQKPAGFVDRSIETGKDAGMIAKAFAPEATPTKDENTDGINDHIRALRAVAHKGIKQGGPKGDVRLSTDPSLYAPFDDVVAEARKAVAAGTRPVPFQIHNALDIGIGETDRVIAALSAQKPGELVKQWAGASGKGLDAVTANIEKSKYAKTYPGHDVTVEQAGWKLPNDEPAFKVVVRTKQPPPPADTAQAATESVAPAREAIEHVGVKIYPVTFKDEPRWAVQTDANKTSGKVFGDTIHSTLDAAKQEAERQVARVKSQQERSAAHEAEAAAAQAKKDANKGKSIVERKRDADLDKPTKLHPNAGLGTGTRRESMQKAVDQDRYIEAATVRDEAAKKRDTDLVERSHRANLPTGNINYPGVKEYFEAQARLKANKYEKPEYRVYMGRDGSDSFYEITKTEYDYAQELKAEPKDLRENYIKSAADSIGRLRKSDVDRVLNGLAKDNIDGVTRADLAAYIKEKHPDYTQEVDDVLAEIATATKSPADLVAGDRFKDANGAEFQVWSARQGRIEAHPVVDGKPVVNRDSVQRWATTDAVHGANPEYRTDIVVQHAAVHQDPGKAPEAATAPVIAQSLAKAGKNEQQSQKEMRLWLVGEIDKAVKLTEDYADYQDSVNKNGQDIADSIFFGKHSRNIGLNTQAGNGMITFDVPGDGKFKIRNSLRGLMEFRAKVEAKSGTGFTDKPTKAKGLPASTGVAKGSASQIEALSSMLEELDFEAAVDYARETGTSLDSVKISPEVRKQFETYLKDGTEPQQFSPSRYWEYPGIDGADKDGNPIRRATLTKQIGADEYQANVTGTNATGFKYNITKSGKSVHAMLTSNSFANALKLAEDAINAIQPEVVKPKDTGDLRSKLVAQSKVTPEVKAITQEDVAAAERHAIGMLQAAIDKMKADAAQRFAVRFLPTMGVKVPVGKARINAAMTDPKINLMGAADALDVTFAKSINDALQAKQEGRISDAVEPQKAEKPTAIANTKEFTAIKRGDFYEIEGDNAKEAAKILGLTLTQNRDGVPMVGVPYHAYDRMVAELAKAGVVFEVKMPESASSASSANEDGEKTEPWKMTRAEAADAFPGDEYDKMLNRHAVLGDITYEEANKRSRINITGNKEFWAKTRKDLLQDKKDAVKFARGDRAEVNKMKPTEGFAAWRIKSMSATGKAAIEAAGKYHDELLAVHKERVQEALDEGKDVPAEVLADYPDLAKPDDSVKPEAKQEPANTENAGEELKANRRGKRTTGLQWAEIEGKDAALRVAETVKAKVYPKPDYQAIADAATHPLVAYIVKLAYDAIAPKPNTATAPTDAQLKGYIEGVNAYMAGVLAWAGDAAKTKQWLVRQGTRAGVFLGASSGTTTALSGLNAVTEKTLLETVYPDGWRNHEAQVRLIGANKVLGALQPGLDDASKGMKELDKGWPSKQEAWQKQGYRIIKGDDLKPDYFENDTKGNERVSAYVQMRLGGRNVYVAQKSFNGITSRADPQVQAWVTEQMAKYQGQFLVMDKRNNVVDFAATEDAAKDKARERTKRDSGPDRIDEKGISVEAAKRTGVDRRMPGEDISADRLMQTYGFKGVNFGNWMLGDSNAKERQLHLNHAFDAFADLAEVLEIPPKAISMNGMLGFAVGAQGNGGRAAAHFVPGVNEINLTREAGAGALAHEWGHALDHYFAKLAGLDRETESYLTEHAHLGAKIQRIEKNAEGKHVNTTRDRFGPELRPEILERFKAIVQAMEKRPMTAEEVAAQKAAYAATRTKNLDSWLKSVRRDFEGIRPKVVTDAMNAETLAAFDKLAAKIIALDVGDGKIAISSATYISPVVDELRSLYKKAAGRQYQIEQVKGLQASIDAAVYSSKSKDDDQSHVAQTTSTKYASEAGKLDRDEDRKPPYWRTKLEMFARAFDAYVSDKLAAKAANNTYLHGLNKDERTVPVGDERTVINAQFDALVQTIETKETDGGNVAMFSQNLVAPQSTGPKPTLEQIQGFVEKILQVAKNVIPVSVIASPHEIAGVKVPVGTKPTGAVIDGRIYLFADNIGSVGSAYVTLFHEVFHLGLQKVIPAEDYAAMLKQFANSPLVAKYIRLWKDSAEGVQKAKTMPSQNYEALANEEALAMVSETLAANDGMGTKNLPGLAKLMLNWLAKVADRIGMPVDFSNWVRDLTRTEAERFVNDMVRAVLGGQKNLTKTQAKYGTTLAEMTAQTRLSAGKATNQTDSMAFKAWFSGSKVVDAEGKPLMVYHGTSADFAIFKPSHGDFGDGIYMTSDAAEASDYANNWSPTTAKDGANVMPVYASLQNPYYTTPEDRKLDSDVVRKKAEKLGHDGIIRTWKNSDQIHVIAFNPTQIKSAIGNNGNFDASNPDIRFSQGLGGTLSSAANSARDVNLPAGYKVADLFQGEGRLSYWHKSVGTMYNLAQRSPPFKRVFDSVQNFLNDVSFYAAEAADLAPSILPKLDKITDIAKSPLSAADTKALSRPVFEGTLTWGRNSHNVAMPLDDIEAGIGATSVDDKAHMLLREGHIDASVLRMWQGLPMEQYETIINGKFEKEVMKPGVVFTPAELKEHFKMTGEKQEDGTYTGQIGLYQEFRKATDKSIDNLAISEMLNYAGKDALPVREAVLASGSVQEAGQTLRDYLVSLTEMEPERDEALSATAAKMLDIAAHATDMKDRGYAPLSRFGNYTLEATLPTGERYFSLFETDRERNKMARMLTSQGATGVSAGTMSQEAYKLLNGITPETAALFGEMLGLESQGSEAKDLAFQEYIKRGTANRSAMKRLLQRKGIAGFSEDSGRVLAGFIYSNSRRTSSNLHAKETTEAVSAIPKEQGELKDTAVKLHEYVSNPAEEAQAFRGILFAQYLGGSVASAMVNATQPFTVTLPYLTQFGGVKKAAAQMVAAVRDATKDTTGNAALDAALKKAEEDGIVSPQEVHSLQAQAMGRAQLQAGDGTTMGNALAMGNNAISKMSLAWGKVFGLAEQFNRRTTFIAAYRTAIEQGIANPAKFAEKAVMETQFVYNKGNKPRWGRGAIGATLFTFKQYSVNYLEMVHRMATAGEPGSPERAAGRKAAALAIAILFMLAGSEGLPFVEDIEDVLDGALQRMGYNFSSKQSMKAFLVTQLGKDGAEFVTSGISGLPGAPIDVSGRLGMGNLIPGTGLFQKKTDHTRDLMELAGPAGDMIKRTGQATEQLLGGNVVGAAKTIAPTAARNLDKAYDMTKTGMYRDDKGSKIIDTDGFEAVAKAIGFQPRSVKNVQDASREVQRAKAQYTLASGEIRAKMAQAIFMGDDDMKQSARDDVMAWNRNNPDQRMTIDMPTVLRKVREMRKSKEQRIADTAPKALRSQVREQLRGELH